MSVPILELRKIEKSFLSYWLFKKIPAVEEVSFRLEQGEAYGFLGHNGAGKTTTLKCITGILSPTSGEILFEGESLIASHQREAIGFLPEYPYFYDHLSVSESLHFFGRLYGMASRLLNRRIPEVLEEVGLTAKAHAKIRTLSKGLQQRLGLGQAILNKPRLLILDEPFSGLDPNGRADVRHLIARLKQEGTSILMSSHILSDVEEICSVVGIMAKGKLVTELSLDTAGEMFEKGYVVSLHATREEVLSVSGLLELHTSGLLEFEEHSSRDARTNLLLADYASARHALSACMESNITVERFDSVGQTLEEIYLTVTEMQHESAQEPS